MKKLRVSLLLCWIFLQIVFPLVCSAQNEGRADLEGIIGSLTDAGNQEKTALSSLLSGEGGDQSKGLLSDITPAKIIAWVIFNSIGFVAFIYGKKQKVFGPVIIGILLMTYNMFVTNTAWLYTVGVALCVALYFFRE